MAEYTLQHTAVEVDNAVGKALSIEANPTMAGTEAALNGLQIGNTKYKVEAGSEVHTYRDSKNYTSADADFEQLKEDILNKRIIQIGTAYFYFYEIWNSTYYIYYSFDAATKVDTSTYVNEKYVAINYGTENVYIYPISTFKINKVEANQSLAGTENNLTELTVQNTKYKLDYLPLTGGTITGNLKLGGQYVYIQSNNNRDLLNGSNGVVLGNSMDRVYIITQNDTNIQHTRNGHAYDVLDTTNGLQLSGGTMTGPITCPTGTVLKSSNLDILLYDSTEVYIGGATTGKTMCLRTTGNNKLYHRVNNTTNYEILDENNTQANPGNTTASLTSLKLNGTNYAIAGGTQVTFVDWS